MDNSFSNVYDDDQRAEAYAGLGYPGTYFLAFRDLPELFARHVPGSRALDFGCGTGRSTRFLRDRGFRVVGVDISRPMLEKARSEDPTGDYRHVPAGQLAALAPATFDLVLAAFTFDNIPTVTEKERTLLDLRRRLAPGGRMVLVVSAPEIYVNEWASFSTRDFPANRLARSGDKVFIVMLDVPDRRPVEDILTTDVDYRGLFRRVGLDVLETLRPRATGDEPMAWKSETAVAPWVIYVLGIER